MALKRDEYFMLKFQSQRQISSGIICEQMPTEILSTLTQIQKKKIIPLFTILRPQICSKSTEQLKFMKFHSTSANIINKGFPSHQPSIFVA